jgi:hypothetical protein
MTSSTQEQKSNTSSTNSFTPANIGYLDTGFNAAQNALGTAQANNVAPSGFVAGLTPQQLQQYQQIVASANGNQTPQQLSQLGSTLGTAGTAGIQGALNGYAGFNPTIQSLSQAGNQYAAGENIPAQVQAALRDATNQVRDVTLPGIDSNAAGTGNTNSSRTGIAQGLVERDLANKGADLSAELQNSAYNTGANLQQTNNAQQLQALGGQGATGAAAAGIAPGALTSSVGTGSTLAGLGLLGASGGQQNQQDIYNNQIASNAFSQTNPFTALSQYLQNVGSYNAGGTGTGTSVGDQTTTSTPSMMSVIGALLGGGGSLLGSSGGALGGGSGLLGAGLFSDRRLKQDIVQVGSLFDGTPVYRYRYIGQQPMQIGVMAQDIEKFAPGAVGECLGYKTVDYEKATERALAN